MFSKGLTFIIFSLLLCEEHTINFEKQISKIHELPLDVLEAGPIKVQHSFLHETLQFNTQKPTSFFPNRQPYILVSVLLELRHVGRD